MFAIDFSDLSDEQVRAQYISSRSDFLAGTVLTGGNVGESGFNRAPQVDTRVRMYALFREMVRRKLTAIPLPTRRTSARFRDPIGPIY